ncbi:reverse transcriptase domain-containing protein [Tanacetum coccineum]
MSAMANSTPVITTVRNTDGREKTPRETDTTPQASIQEFCEKHYDDILPIIMEKARQDKRKGLQSRLDIGDTPKRARRIRSDSLSSGDRNSPASQRKRSAFERLSNTYSPSMTKSGPSNTTPRDRSRGKNPSDSRDRSSDRSRSRIRSHLRGVEESYDETYSSQRTRHKDRSHKDGHHGGMKKKRVNESLSSRASVSSSSHGMRQRPRRRCECTDEEDLAVPWTCEDVDPFTPSIRAARVWFDELPAESIDGYKDLKTTFLSYFMQQKKYVKDPVEIHNIKQKDEETIEEFMEHFKTETG